MISEEQVKHIAKLARLNVNDDEMEKYQKQLSDILTEIKKIEEVNITEDTIMISPSNNKNNYSEDVIESHISKSDALVNAKRTRSDYITVPRVLEGEEEWDI